MAGKYHFYRFLWGCLDWLFPPVCAGCQKPGYRWCPECRVSIKHMPEPICQVCGMSILQPGICHSCRKSPPPYLALRSWAIFEGPVRDALHSLKYGHNITLADVLARDLAIFVHTFGWKIDAVIPVPIGRERLKERGYNQVALLAEPLAGELGLQYLPRILRRTRETRSQVGLSPEERKKNVAGAFIAEKNLATGRNILLVDDVATTGATLAESAAALKTSGADTIYALTLARALPHHGFQIV